jgi:signal peptidase I
VKGTKVMERNLKDKGRLFSDKAVEPEEVEEVKESKEVKIEKEDSKDNQSSPSLLRELVALGLKIAIIAITLILTFTFIFGFQRSLDEDMNPMVKAGDLVMYYRLDKDYSIGDLLLLDLDGEVHVRRVIAKEGDIVDIDEQGLKINGSWQQEKSIFQETWQYEEGIDFPAIIGAGELFVLGDARENATDSRIYGPVNADDTLGTVVTVIRQRNF